MTMVILMTIMISVNCIWGFRNFGIGEFGNSGIEGLRILELGMKRPEVGRRRPFDELRATPRQETPGTKARVVRGWKLRDKQTSWSVVNLLFS